MLDGRGLLKSEIITKGNMEIHVPPHGIDLNVISIKMMTSMGVLHENGEKSHADLQEIEYYDHRGTTGWKVSPGMYAVTFDQGCEIPKGSAVFITHRSSLLKSGATITSGIYDYGYESKNVEAFMIVHNTLFIELGARIAVAYELESDAKLNYKNQYKKGKK